MLFIVTGETQTGKTRWLMSLLGTLEDQGVVCYGVVSPGRWEECVHYDEHTFSEKTEFVKQGIDALLLPERKHLLFAKKCTELTPHEIRPNQSSKLGLGWYIFDEAIEQVNAHLKSLITQEGSTKGLLVVDELGILELEAGGGFTMAVDMLKQGPTVLYDTAIFVVRSALYAKAEELARPGWKSIQQLEPNDSSAKLVLKALC